MEWGVGVGEKEQYMVWGVLYGVWVQEEEEYMMWGMVCVLYVHLLSTAMRSAFQPMEFSASMLEPANEGKE